MQTSEKRFRALIEHGLDNISLLSANGDLQWESPATIRTLGYSPDEFIGHNILELIHPDDASAARKQLAELAREPGGVQRGSLRIKHSNGTWHWIEIIASNLLAEPGVNAIVMNYRDITGRKQAEETLRESDEKFLSAFEYAAIGMALVSPDGHWLKVNQALCNILGYSIEELMSRTFQDITHPDDIETDVNYIRQMLAGKIQTYQMEKRYFHKLGHLVWVLLSVSLVRDDTGEPLYFIAQIQDITERKHAEQELRDSEERFRQLADNIEQVFWITEPESKKEIYISPAGEKIWGRSIKRLLQNPQEFIESVLPEDRPIVLATLEKQSRGEKTEMEYRIQRSDGSVRWIWDRGFPVFGDTGKIVRVAGIAADVTERKRAEEVVRQYASELERRVEERTAELSRANRAKDEFLAIMSHELRTPLSSILGLSETLLDGMRGSLNEQQGQAVKMIASSGKHLLGLINDILDVSKIEAGKLDIHPETIAVEEICRASLTFVKELAVHKSIAVDFHFVPGVSTILADSRRLKQILVNLLSNAVKFTPENGKVSLEVRTDVEQNQILFSVTDTGIGIAPEDLPRLFKPFVQVDSSFSRLHEGSGLGLVLVHRLAEMHGGNVYVESEVGKGSRFTVVLPWYQKTETQPSKDLSGVGLMDAAHEVKTIEAITTPEAGLIDRGTILLAEDNETNVLVLKDYLEYRGYEVVVAHNGVEVFAILEEITPRIILMDIQMPDMDGLEATRRLRDNPRFASMPIIALTAFAMPGDRERCLEAGASEYLSKPVSLKALKQMIETFL